MGNAVQATHLLLHDGRLSPVPAIGEDHHRGTTGHSRNTPLVVEHPQPVAQPGSPGPVGDGYGGPSQGGIRIAGGELAGQAGQAGPQGKGLHITTPDHCGMEEPDEGPGIGLHGTAHVQQQDKAPGANPRFGEGPVDRFTAGPECGPDRPAQIGSATVQRRAETPAPAGGAEES